MNKTPKERPPTRPLWNMQTLKLALLVSLASAAVLLAALVTTPGCASKPTPLPTPTEPLPPPDVGECKANLESMQAAVRIANISAALLVSKDSKYGPAIKVALSAIDGALAEAKAQCSTGNVDGWAIALAAFDKAFAQLVDAGDELHAATMPNDIQPPPPYAVSLDEFNAMAFELETSYVEVAE